MDNITFSFIFDKTYVRKLHTDRPSFGKSNMLELNYYTLTQKTL
jgi:hypothetical protein